MPARDSSGRFQADPANALRAAGKDLARVLTVVVHESRDPERALYAAVMRIRNDIVRSLHHIGSGRLYQLYAPRRTHRASAPGEAPASDTGQLANSYVAVQGRDAQGIYVELGTNQPRAAYLELGTRQIEPRPHFRPAVERGTRALALEVADAVVRAQRAAVARMPKEREV